MRDGQHAGVKTAFLVLDWPLKGGRMLVAVTLYTTCMNLLALTCPVYMFMLYDRVLPAHDAGKLLALTFAMLLALCAKRASRPRAPTCIQPLRQRCRPPAGRCRRPAHADHPPA